MLQLEQAGGVIAIYVGCWDVLRAMLKLLLVVENEKIKKEVLVEMQWRSENVYM